MLKMPSISPNTCINPPLYGHLDALMNLWKIPNFFANHHNTVTAENKNTQVDTSTWRTLVVFRLDIQLTATTYITAVCNASLPRAMIYDVRISRVRNAQCSEHTRSSYLSSLQDSETQQAAINQMLSLSEIGAASGIRRRRVTVLAEKTTTMGTPPHPSPHPSIGLWRSPRGHCQLRVTNVLCHRPTLLRLETLSPLLLARDTLSEEIWAALNIEVLRADEGEARRVWCSAGMKRRGETGEPRENPPISGVVQHDFHVRKPHVKIRERPRRESKQDRLGGRREGAQMRESANACHLEHSLRSMHSSSIFAVESVTTRWFRASVHHFVVTHGDQVTSVNANGTKKLKSSLERGESVTRGRGCCPFTVTSNFSEDLLEFYFPDTPHFMKTKLNQSSPGEDTGRGGVECHSAPANRLFQSATAETSSPVHVGGIRHSWSPRGSEGQRGGSGGTLSGARVMTEPSGHASQIKQFSTVAGEQDRPADYNDAARRPHKASNFRFSNQRPVVPHIDQLARSTRFPAPCIALVESEGDDLNILKTITQDIQYSMDRSGSSPDSIRAVFGQSSRPVCKCAFLWLPLISAGTRGGKYGWHEAKGATPNLCAVTCDAFEALHFARLKRRQRK
ncbi:hypothetical protein PR048_028944 [Dryococelus australis]|uniref:Uncharacterized protein n=1 Tax=Dryococelus australis TaxID=614101 RepID=A0ABQ9GC02_9NEOP|nr:hypothetical protein PR048_028944 [Dryococelus australis]